MWGGMVAFVFGSVGGCRSETTGTDLRVCRGSSFVSRGATVSRFSVSKKRTDRSTAKIVMVTSTGLKKVVIAGKGGKRGVDCKTSCDGFSGVSFGWIGGN